MMATAEHNLFYDGNCGLCRSIVRSIDKRRRIQPLRCIDIHDERAMSQFPQVDRDEAMESVILLEPSGRKRYGYDASVGVVGLLRGMRPVHWFMRLPIIRSLGKFSYKFVTNHRYRISKMLHLE